jgi:hypothetical protein
MRFKIKALKVIFVVLFGFGSAAAGLGSVAFLVDFMRKRDGFSFELFALPLLFGFMVYELVQSIRNMKKPDQLEPRER